MGKFVECVPNFSEGRDISKIEAIVDAARAVPGVLVLDVEKVLEMNHMLVTSKQISIKSAENSLIS